ncbi:MAG: exodeoxyribonuclease III [Armatimonadota bacterium]
MRIATWNVNSIRARIPVIEAFVEDQAPHVLCMQETKVADDDFPREPIEAMGYEVAFGGEKSYNGVATASRLTMTVTHRGFDDGGPPDASRLLVAEIQPTPEGGRTPIPVVNTYVPQGRDPEDEAFRYKLDWLQRLRDLFDRTWTPRKRILWVGDMNVAPTERDVYAPERFGNHPDFHPDARAAFAHTAQWGFVDVFRLHNDEDGQFTFYDYRDTQSVERGHGWRVDHIMATRPLARLSTRAWIDLAPRRAQRPSDHAPLLAEFEL